jgi:hypothetical protein
LFDGHQEHDGYLLTLKFGEGLLPCLHHLNLVVKTNLNIVMSKKTLVGGFIRISE